MSLFCLLWIPFFYLFWRAATGNHAFAGGVWALFLGSAAALIQFFVGPLIYPGGFELSRWLSGCVNVVALPVLFPLLVYLALIGFKIIGSSADFAGFTLLWLCPAGVFQAVNWSAGRDPVPLVLVPLLWTAVAVGIPFFITLIMRGRVLVIIASSLGILAVPFAAASSYWAFYGQKHSLGCLFFAAAALPALISMLISLLRDPG